MKQIQTLNAVGGILLVAAMLLTGVVVADDAATDPEHFYQLVFIYMKDPAKFQEYAQKLGPVVSKYGGFAERIIMPESIYPDSIDKPDMVNIVYYDSEEAYRQFEKDPEFLALKPLRAQAIDMKGINARPSGGQLIDGDLQNRPYMVELAYFKDGNPQGFEAYKKKATPLMREFGFRTERSLEPVSVFGGIKKPDVVNIHFFEDEAQRAQFESDPRHAEVEGLYSAAIEDLIWIEGRAMTH